MCQLDLERRRWFNPAPFLIQHLSPHPLAGTGFRQLWCRDKGMPLLDSAPREVRSASTLPPPDGWQVTLSEQLARQRSLRLAVLPITQTTVPLRIVGAI